MKKQISNISGHQTSKVFSLMYVVITIPICIIGVIMLLLSPGDGADSHPAAQAQAWFFIFAPIIYGIFGYIFSRLGCFGYNLVAKYFGGVEFTVIEKTNS